MDYRAYFTKNYLSTVQGKTLLTGIRGVKNSARDVYISGFYKTVDDLKIIAFVYEGGIFGNGIWHELGYPSSENNTVTSTSLYGPNNGKKKRHIQVVGNYTNEESGDSAIGCLYEGNLDGKGKWTTIIPTSSNPVLNTICHSTMGGLIVGNYDTNSKIGKAFIYDIETKKYFDIVKLGAISITAYGIWHNICSSYTICGGFSNFKEGAVDTAYLVDWDNHTHTFHNWRDYSYGNNHTLITHFDGITSDEKGGYNLTGDWKDLDNSTDLAFFANVKRCKCKKSFTRATWESISYPNQPITSGNSVYQDTVIGVYASPDSENVNGYISILLNK
uniref:Uncharacterized protein n=1 Tax=viral metagenome TaxID=1070528 RepID=A0A6C0CC57_9ZZZZ